MVWTTFCILIVIGTAFSLTSAERGRRFLFGPQGETTLESILPRECTLLSEFEDALDITNQWMREGSYLYLQLLQIKTKQLQHDSTENVEAGYLYLLNKWSENTTTEFREAIKSIEYTSQYRHDICVRMLGFMVTTFLKNHQGSVCAQYQKLPSTELGRNPVQCTPLLIPVSNPADKPTTSSPTTSTTQTRTTMSTTKPTTSTIATTTPKTSITTRTTPTTETTESTSPSTTTYTTLTTTTSPSTSTESTSTTTTTTTPTTTTPTTTFNNNKVCAICDDQSCRNNDTDLQHCSSSTDLCVTMIVDTTADRHFYRRCIAESYCRNDYSANGGYKTFCFMADSGPFNFDYNCTFCCTDDKCNIGPNLVPAQETLYTAN